MARPLLCDVCRNPIERVALKLYKAKKESGGTDHNNYTAHADIGPCCVVRINEINWTDRKRLRKKDANAPKAK